MTRQEALHELYTIFGYGFYNERVDEALDIAIKALEHEQNCVKCKHYTETEDDTGVHSNCKATCSNNAQVDKLRKAAEETDDNGVRKGILKAIEVLKGDTEWSR